MNTVPLSPAERAELRRMAALCRCREQVEAALRLVVLARFGLPPDLMGLASSATAALGDLADALNVKLEN